MKSNDAPPVSPAVRFIRNTLATLLTLGALAWAGDLYRTVGLLLFQQQFLVAMLGTGLER